MKTYSTTHTRLIIIVLIGLGITAARHTRAAIRNPAVSEAQKHVNLGQYVAELRDYERAAQHFEMALAQASRSKAVMFTLGALYQKMGALEKARAVYSNMVAQFPTDADGHTCLGNVYLLQDRLPEAITSYERALRYDRTHAVALRNLGFAELRNGDATMAIQYLQRSARIDPTNALVWFDLGMANFSAGKPFEACASFRRGLRLDSSSEARLTYTEVLDQQAGRLLERAIDAYASNDFSTAEAILTAVIKAYPDYAPAHAYLGHVYNHQKPSRQIEAEQAYRAALAARNYTLLEPDVAAAVLDNLGMLRLDAGDFEDAETLFRQATLLDTRYPVAFFNYGLMMARRGLYDAAAVAFADAARRDPALLEYVGHHPALDAFRTSPAYSNLMHSIEWQSN